MEKTDARRLLEPLMRCPTAPYHEDAVADYIAATVAGFGLDTTTDSYGNLIVRRPSTGRTTTRLAFMAHMDHPGFEVTAVGPDGVVAAWHGGVQPEYFTNARVRFHAGGQVARGAIRTAALTEDRTHVKSVVAECDGAPPVGALGVWDLPDVEFTNGSVRAPAIDDLAGCGVILAMLADLRGRQLDAEVWAFFTRAEEVGFIGAVGLARSGRLPLSLPIVSIEMSKAMPGATQGMGPVIRLGDRSSVFDQSMLLFARDTAAELKEEREGFKYQRLLMDGGSCEATALNAFGFRTAGLALALSNYHNQAPAGPNGPWTIDAEEINFSDFLHAVDLAVAMCERFPGLQRVMDRHRRTLLERTGDRLVRLQRQQRERERR